MTFVVVENCIRCKYTDCVEVCPVDCFHEGPNFLVIDPDECIDCTLCEPECPAKAIYPEDDVPAGQEGFLALNAELSKVWPVITVRIDPPAVMGSEDFAFMLEHRPGCYLFLGNGDGEGSCMVHNPGYDFNDAAMETGAAFWALLAQRFLV